MKKIIVIIVALIFSGTSYAGQHKHSTYYEQRASLFEELPTTPQDIIFLGNSITDGGEWCELFDNANIKNRGISGDVTEGILDRLSVITKGKPAKIFMMIGINDIAYGISSDTIVRNIEKIVRKIKQDSPDTRIYLQSILPVNMSFGMFRSHTLQSAEIEKTNKLLFKLAYRQHVTYIDLHSYFTDDDGWMNTAYTNDGLHLTGKGYILWRDILLPFINENRHSRL